MTASPPIDPKHFDRIVTRDRRDGMKIIWTLQAIGAAIGVGPDFVRDTLAKQPGSPVKEIGGRYYAFEEDLIRFLRFQGGDDQADYADCNGRP